MPVKKGSPFEMSRLLHAYFMLVQVTLTFQDECLTPIQPSRLLRHPLF